MSVGYRVVIIDDEPWTREVLRSLGAWEALGLSVVGEACDGEYGLELIRQLQPDIVLTDIQMPMMNGIELMEKLRRQDHRTRVIMVSGYDEFTYVRSAMRLEATDYLLKPVKGAELNAQLEKCIQQLNEMERQAPQQDISGFMDAPWVKEYMPLREALQTQLTTGDAATIRIALEKIKAVIHEPCEKALIIALYYDLIGMLERFVVAAGYSIGEVLQRKTMVFSGETTVAEIFLHVTDQYLSAMDSLRMLIRSQKGLDLAQVESYVAAHAMGGVSLEQTARQFFITREYLSKAFKQHAGIGFSEYVLRIRMQKAKELLASGVAPKELSAAVGFAEQASFYKVFKRFYGVTPGEMQRQIKNEQ